MFTLRPESIKTFINDQTIRLPRFQRKQTWSDEKNFNVCISLFKDFPLGVVVIKIDSGNGSKKGHLKKWLLDGRQRQNVLKNIRNPERIYSWAKNTIGFSSRSDPSEVVKEYWDYIDYYLEEEEAMPLKSEEALEIQEGPIESDVSFELNDDVVDDTDSLPVSYRKNEDEYDPLNDLLELILMVHPIRKNSSGFTSNFNFCKYIQTPEFTKIDPQTGALFIDSDALITWIDSKSAFDRLHGKQYPPTKEQFCDWLLESRNIDETTKKKMLSEVDRRWKKIIEILHIIDRLDKRLQEAKIGYLELSSECSDTDAKKIFEIINTAGTPLTAAEILSAKPSWNKPVENPHEQILKDKENLYKQMKIKDEGIVRWDIPATMLDRLESQTTFILGNWSKVEQKELEKKITLGFKIYSGYYLNAVTKGDISKLSLDAYLKQKGITINWGSIKAEETINRSCHALMQNNFFKYWNSWNSSIMDVLSDAVAINFLLIMSKNWIGKNEPISTSSDYRKFQKESIILFDRLIFEYVTKRWRGSSDSLIASNIKEFQRLGSDYFKPITNEEWKHLLEEMISKGTINGQPYVKEKLDPRVRGILYYYYVLKQIAGPNDPTIIGIDIDHIIPQSAFTGRENASSSMNNLVNLGLLPKRQNVSKGAKKLDEIEDPWLIQQIETYEEIPKNLFSDYSTVESFDKLKEYRGCMIIDSVIKGRDYWIRSE